MRALLVVAVLLGQWAVPSGPGIDPAAAESLTERCTEGGVTWVVDHTRDFAFGGIVKVDGLTRIEDGVSTDASGLTWELRWGPDPVEWGDPPDGPPTVGPYHAVRGPLSAFEGQWRSVFASPRLVTPDGACQVYLSPFANIAGTPGQPRVAVLGDSLVQQLNQADVNDVFRQGFVEEELNASGILAQVEGGTGNRWTPDDAADPLDRAESHLAPGYRGLLEHDVDGFVVMVGAYDALYIAEGATEAEREARRVEVYGKLTEALGEVASRTPCLQVVTVPENPSSVDPDYAWAANQVNNFFRWVLASGDPETGVELVDFAAEAASHAVGDPEPWFGADGLHLNAAGRGALTETLGAAARRCADGVVLWGAPGTLDQGVQADATSLPSGLPLTTRAVEDWGFEPGKGPHFSTVAADGTVFFMSASTSGNVFVEGGEGMQLTAFNPETGAFTNVPLTTDRNREVPERACTFPWDDWPWDGPWCGTDGTHGLSYGSGDVDVVHDGETVVLTGYGVYGGQDIETEGQFPVFAALTRTADGDWEQAEGPDTDGDGQPDWRNAWSPREIYDLAPAALRPALDEICAMGGEDYRTDPEGRPVRDCPWTNEIAVLPESGHIVVVHYPQPGITVLDLGEPDADGRMALEVVEAYVLPAVDDPENPGTDLAYAAREAQADPTSTMGDERFGLLFDFAPGFVELSYDASAPLGERVEPVSAPVLSGELTAADGDGMRQFMSHQQFAYDHDGNLWVPSGTTGWGGQRLGIKVYANSPSGRKLTAPECLETGADGQPLPVEEYVAVSADPDVRPAWGHVCAPDYNIVQARALGIPWGVAIDPLTGNAVVTTWPQGETIVIEAEGSGADMTFGVGNVVHPMANETSGQVVEGPCRTWNVLDPDDYPLPESDPEARCSANASLQAIQGPIDDRGRLWLGVRQGTPPSLQTDAHEMVTRRLDQWAYSVDVSLLLGRVPHGLTARPGEATVVHAERTGTVETVAVPGDVAVTDVLSVAGLTVCREHRIGWGEGCVDPVSGLSGAGYVLGNPVGGAGGHGVAPGTVAEYRVVVPKGGSYQVAYRASDRDQAGDQRIRLRVDGQVHETPIHCPVAAPGCDARRLQTIDGPVVTLAAGVHTVELSAPEGGHGWELDWLRFTRVP